MTVGELMTMLAGRPPNAQVIVMLEGSAFATDNKDEHKDYNATENEFYILATDWETT